LSLIATKNNGIAEFLGTDELEERITDFYLKIRNPVLLNPTMEFSSPSITETYPSPLPNLYKGEQLLVTGLYDNASALNVTFKGTAFGKPVEYQYGLTLSDTAIQKNQFLPKIWAKKKIEYLLVQYFNLPSNTQQADSIKKLITSISVSYGVISPFTSFSNTNPGASVVENDHSKKNIAFPNFIIEGNYPNPFNPETVLRFSVNKNISTIVRIRIYNYLGQFVRELSVSVNGSGIYNVTWNGKDKNGSVVASGTYIAVFDFGIQLLAHKMMMVK
jgi:Ca-activated chloride channel homolog